MVSRWLTAPRLIDADTAAAFAENCGATFVAKKLRDSTAFPEVVTRCKDCKHRGWVQEPCHGKSVDYCRVWDCTLRNLESTFCGYGEPKEGTTHD